MDIEGTLIPVSFVRETLFPFAKDRLVSFLHERRHDPDVLQWTAVCQDVIEHETGTRPSFEELPVTLISWIDQDRKLAGLKALQGKIWEEGYRQLEFAPELYGDVLPAFTQWRARHPTGNLLVWFGTGTAAPLCTHQRRRCHIVA